MELTRYATTNIRELFRVPAGFFPTKPARHARRLKTGRKKLKIVPSEYKAVEEFSNLKIRQYRNR